MKIFGGKKEKNISEEAQQVKKKLKRGIAGDTFFLGSVVFVFLLFLFGGLYYIFKPYTITFDLADGSEPLTQKYSLSSGSFDLGIPTRTGYRFTGWTGSNGTKAERNVTIKGGILGNLSYKANWTDELVVYCQDWIVDSEGNKIVDITASVDSYLKNGDSSKNYGVVDRTIKVKAGTTVDPASWGNDKAYKAYHSDYMYIGNSGKVNISEDETVVYRYFYPVFDVNYLLDDARPADSGIKDSSVGTFDLYVDSVLKAENVTDFCSGIPYGATYKIVPNNVYPGYEFVYSETDTGTMLSSRNNLNISFATKEGTIEVTCEDWVVDADGNRLKEITAQVDRYLESGKSSKNYEVRQRTVKVSTGDIINGNLWGNDTSIGAYYDDYAFIESSGDVEVTGDGVVVYRYFYPVLNIDFSVNGESKGSSKGYARFNVYVDDELVQENVYDFRGTVPSGSTYSIELAGYDDYSYIYKPSYSTASTMGNYARKIVLNLSTRTGDSYVVIEDWVVDIDGNRIREITDEIDAFLSAGNSGRGFSTQNRIIKVSLGETINPAEFGNDISVKAYSSDYVYGDASESVTVSESGMKIYRYFYPVLDINGSVDGSGKNLNGIATFNILVNGELVGYQVSDYCYGAPVGSTYEIRRVRTTDGYKYVETDSKKGSVLDERTTVVLDFVTKY